MRTNFFQPYCQRCPAHGLAWLRHVCRSNSSFNMDFSTTHYASVVSHISKLSQDYPENTVRGRVCLGLRLDWDLNSTKETSDIYVKPRLVILKPYFSLHFNSTDFHRIRRGSIRSRIVVLLKQTFETISLWNNRLIVLALTTGWFFFMCYIITR